MEIYCIPELSFYQVLSRTKGQKEGAVGEGLPPFLTSGLSRLLLPSLPSSSHNSYPRNKSHRTLSSQSPQRSPPHFCHLSPDARHCHACYTGRKTEACTSWSCGHSPDSLTVFPRPTESFCIDTSFCGSAIN